MQLTKTLKGQSGNIALAMLLAVVAMMSGLSISSMSLRDTIAQQAEYDSIEELHLLRAESFRAQAFLETASKENPSLGGGIRTPAREIQITGSNYGKTYKMQSRIYRQKAESEGFTVQVGGQNISGGTGASATEYVIQSLIEGKTGIGQVAYFSKNASLVRKYSELLVIQDTGPIFMYFTDTDASPHGNTGAAAEVWFYGYDVLTGPVHSNTDIHIKKAGGGNNDNWPTFLSTVTTAGHIVSNPAQYPRDQIFRGGLVEEYDEYEYPSQMTAVHANGHPVGPPSHDDKYIIKVKVDQFGYEAWWGVIQTPVREFADVWNNYPQGYPYAPGTALYRNNYAVCDTTWTPLPGGTSGGRSNYVANQCWIEGTFRGMQTWGCADTLFLVGDILIDGTNPPANPNTNRYSMVGLISEESILVKYAYRDPVDSLRYWPNCGADGGYADPNAGGGIWIYAALAALGDGRGNPLKDGVFSFEYQHPHGSIPAVRINVPPAGTPTLFDKIDLHRNHWPQSTGNPWPAGLDLPWYNPIWPERSPYTERGTINIWGGVNQRRRGFVHRNYLDADYPNNGVWNPPMDYCGGSSSPANAANIVLYQNPATQVTLVTRPWPGADGSGTGYKKNYNYDTRMYKTKPPDWPEFKKQGERLPMTQGNWVLKRPPKALI